jgi:hypothetical protein
VLAIAYLFFEPVYQSNDDISLEMLASGRWIAAAPTPYLLFPNILLGRLLTFLYTAWPGLPWYRVITTGVHLSASLVIAKLAFEQKWSWGRLVLILNYFLVFDVYFYLRPHFAITAGVAAQAALLLWLSRLMKRERWGWCSLLIFAGLFLMSSLIRIYSCLLIVLQALPTALFAMAAGPVSLANGSSRNQAGHRTPRKVVPGLWPLVSCLLIAAAAQIYNDHSYATSAGWEDFYRYNILRAQFTDYRQAPYNLSTKRFFDQVGWSANDLDMLESWFFLDDKLYSRQKFEQILKSIPRSRAQSPTALIQSVALDLSCTGSFKLMLLSVLLPFCFGFWRPAASIPMVLALLSAFVLSVAIILTLQRLPPWLYVCLLSFGPCLALILPMDGSWKGLQLWRRCLVGTVITLLLIYGTGAIVQFSRESDVATYLNEKMEAAIGKLDPKPNQLYVVWGGAFPFELILSGKELERWRDFKMLGTGFTAHSPINRTRLREFGIQDIVAALFQRKDVFLIAHGRRVQNFVQYVKEHYGKEIVPVERLQTTFGLWRAYDGMSGKITSSPRGFRVYQFVETKLKATP